MNTSELSVEPRIEGKTDNEETYPVSGYEVIVLNWLEELRSATSVDEPIESEEI
jgi:hypothetical protein